MKVYLLWIKRYKSLDELVEIFLNKTALNKFIKIVMTGSYNLSVDQYRIEERVLVVS